MNPYGKIRTPQDLGRLIRHRRKESGIPQADAAALSGVGPRYLSELERGKESAELGKALQVLQRLGLDVWVLPRGATPEKADD